MFLRFGRIPSLPCSPFFEGGREGRGRCVSGFASLRASQAAINRGSTSHPPTLRQAQGPRRPYTHLAHETAHKYRLLLSDFDTNPLRMTAKFGCVHALNRADARAKIAVLLGA